MPLELDYYRDQLFETKDKLFYAEQEINSLKEQLLERDAIITTMLEQIDIELKEARHKIKIGTEPCSSSLFAAAERVERSGLIPILENIKKIINVNKD